MADALNKIKEISIIRSLAKGLKPKRKDVVVSIGDDAAVVLGKAGEYLLYTTDMLVEAVHFKKNEDLKKVGYKAIAVSVSDIAAMGGEPRFALVSCGLPASQAEPKARHLFAGIKACARKYGVDVIGGDTNRSSILVIDIFMAGVVKRGQLVLRSGAKKGDYIFVSGPLGGSLRGKHLNFNPRVDAAHFLVENFKVTSMMDLSDGLAYDLNRLCEASKTGALIFEDKIPKNKGVFKTDSALFDGEDFELLFTLSPKDTLRLMQKCAVRGSKLVFYPIGRMVDFSETVRMVKHNGEVVRVMPGGFRHF